MVKPLSSYRHLLKEKADVWAVGPVGLIRHYTGGPAWVPPNVA